MSQSAALWHSTFEVFLDKRAAIAHTVLLERKAFRVGFRGVLDGLTGGYAHFIRFAAAFVTGSDYID